MPSEIPLRPLRLIQIPFVQDLVGFICVMSGEFVLTVSLSIAFGSGKGTALLEKRCKCPKKIGGGCNPQACSLGNGRCEMFDVVGQQPIGFAHHCREEYGNIRRMTDQMPAGIHQVSFRIRNEFRVR